MISQAAIWGLGEIYLAFGVLNSLKCISEKAIEIFKSVDESEGKEIEKCDLKEKIVGVLYWLQNDIIYQRTWLCIVQG